MKGQYQGIRWRILAANFNMVAQYSVFWKFSDLTILKTVSRGSIENAFKLHNTIWTVPGNIPPVNELIFQRYFGSFFYLGSLPNLSAFFTIKVGKNDPHLMRINTFIYTAVNMATQYFIILHYRFLRFVSVALIVFHLYVCYPLSRVLQIQNYDVGRWHCYCAVIMNVVCWPYPGLRSWLFFGGNSGFPVSSKGRGKLVSSWVPREMASALPPRPLFAITKNYYTYI